jgi:hypothetical protein
MKICEHDGCNKPTKPGGRFCSAVHRAAWSRENRGVIPTRVQSVSKCANGDAVVCVRVLADQWPRIVDWCPGIGLDLLEKDK